MNFKFAPLTVAVLSIYASSAFAEETQAPAANPPVLKPIVVTGAAERVPLLLETDLKSPRQPLPAHDGADYLKTIPGFSVVRKGGTDGDPIFRGMAGSRLNILVDGQNTLGGCNFRMDAPTAYIFPEAYDKLTVIKGPQTVLYGSGNSAGTIMFDRKVPSFEHSNTKLHSSLLLASAGRHDEVLDAYVGNTKVYGQFTGTHSQAGDYKDGNGQSVHSSYDRYSLNGALGWTPDKNTKVELSGVQSDGEAAYADRGMDGTQFTRQGGTLKFEKKNLSDTVALLEAQLYKNSVDHVMDDQELRTPGMMGYANLTRDTAGARVAGRFVLSEATLFNLGLDVLQNDHRSRSAGPNAVYSAFVDDAEFKQMGLFSELSYELNPQQTLLAGYRFDQWHAKDQRSQIKGMMMSYPNPTAGKERDENLHSGFVRLEQQMTQIPAKAYIGFGHTERFPDYWEMIAKESAASRSAFDIAAEKNNQLDFGVLYKTQTINAGVSAFYSRIDDFILVDYTNMMKMNGYSRNIDATTYGAELNADYALMQHWKVDGALAYTHGNNKTDNTPLAQIPPLEAKLGLAFDNQVWSAGLLLRAVAGQHRYDLGKGNIVGKDLGASSGFAVVSANAGWRFNKKTLISAGVDNLFDRAYAEFVSRAGGNGMGGAIPGYPQTTQVNEPGRTLWLKASYSFE